MLLWYFQTFVYPFPAANPHPEIFFHAPAPTGPQEFYQEVSQNPILIDHLDK